MGHPGRYDDKALQLLAETSADAVVLFVLGGDKGSGFSCTVTPHAAAKLHRVLPAMLRDIATVIENEPPNGVRVTTRD